MPSSRVDFEETSEIGELEWSLVSKVLVSLALALLIGVLALFCAEYHVARLENSLVRPAESP
jgi:hypothetical protein